MKRTLLAITLVWGCLVSGCDKSAPAPPSAATSTTVSAVYVRSAYYLPIMVMKHEKLLEKRGYTLDALAVDNNNLMLDRFLTGNCDLAAQSMMTMLQVEKQHPGRFRFVYGQYCRAYMFVVPKGKFKSLSDLKAPDVTIGTWKGPTPPACIALAFQRKAMARPSEDKISQMGIGDVNIALLSGKVQAAFLTDVGVSKLTVTGQYEALEPTIMQTLIEGADEDHLVAFFNGGGFIPTDLVIRDKKKADAIVGALSDALEIIRKDRRLVNEILVKELSALGVTVEIAGAAPLDEFERPHSGMMNIARRTADMLRKLDEYKEKVPETSDFGSLFYSGRE